MSRDVTRVSVDSSTRAYASVKASSPSPVSAVIGFNAFQETEPTPLIRQRRVPGRRSWPSIRERSNPFPAAAGPSQRAGSRVHK